ncbi:DegT/DnrJ/EryC1/StrS family aminotransferase [Methanococcoides sp. SA1]|nr:DegT/DnrJ/EryC1/StrS family aminotransferase [Methanococcoides sp. SA1]
MPHSNEVIPITKPTLPDFQEVETEISEIVSSGMLTNHTHVRTFEEKAAEYLGAKYAVAVSSCTSGLMLSIKLMGLKGEIIIPSFTFHATAHAIKWNGLKLKFVDIDPETYLIDPEKVEEMITPETSAICGVHTFGNPCDIDHLQDIATDKNLKLYFDAAHGFGSKYKNKNIGCFGDAEVFSLSPTKLVVAGEGGLVTTNDKELRDKLVLGRNYGDGGNYNCTFAGFNARMSEINALLATHTLKNIEKNVKQRNYLASRYKELLQDLPGIGYQKISDDSRTTYKDFSIYVDSKQFGMDRNVLNEKLTIQNINSKKYFYPPVHKQDAYTDYANCDKNLPMTHQVAENVLSLPLWSDMPEKYIDRICDSIKNIWNGRA